MKKFAAVLLALVMALSIAACNKDKDGETTPTGEPTTAPTEAEETQPVAGEELPANPLYYNSFDTADGLTAVHQVAATEDPTLTGATYALAPSVHEVRIADGYGAAGSSLMLDGKYGVRVENFPKTADDTYTIAFWYAADHYSQYGPLVQMGRNVGMNDTENEVCWVNFTKTDTWSVEGGECAPVVWNRNSMPGGDAAKAVWPWIGNNADLKGKREWVHVALVVDGVTYDDALGAPHVGATVYVNGTQVMKADASVIGTKDEAGTDTSANWMGVAPNIFSGDGVYGIECLLGVNYWDQYGKLYLDEFYFYDDALTAGQVATLYGMGSAPEYQTMPAYEGPTDDEPAPEPTEATPAPEITPDPGAVDTIGTVARDVTFWTDTTDGFELKDGGKVTFKLNNYSDGLQNYDNVVLALSNTPVTTDKVASADNFPGYAEYGVMRADSWDWGTGNPDGSGTYERSWGDDWASWLALMTDAQVDLTVSRAGSDITAEFTFTGADGTVMTEKGVITCTTLTGDAPCYVHLTADHAYVEILSVA